MKQAQYSPLPIEEQVISIFAGVRGFVDKVKVADVTRFDNALRAELRSKHSDVLTTIRAEKALSDGTQDKLKKIIGDFAAKFA